MKLSNKFTGEYTPTDYDRMFLYIWQDIADLNECKFGERWVYAGLDPLKDCGKRIRGSIGVRKDRFDEGKIVLVAIFDVTELAKTWGRYYLQSRMDDAVRVHIGYRKGSTGEIHRLDGEDMKARVAKFLSKQGQELPEAGLSTLQYMTVGEALDTFDDGGNVILAHLCARFGKTLWAGALALETDSQLIVVAAYVKTVFTSFGIDMNMFEQWSDCVHVDAEDPEYQLLIKRGLRENKQVFVYLSLCNGSKRQERIDFLASRRVDKMWIVDEADFGAHTVNQATPVKEAVSTDDKVILMTGTNADRAVGHWGHIDHIISVTYPELIMQKKRTEAGSDNMNDEIRHLHHFLLNSGRDKFAPDFKCYQMDLSGPVQDAIDAGVNPDDLAGWSKFNANPMRAKGFFSRMLEAVFQGKGDHPELNVDDLTENWTGDRRVAMMFVGANNSQMDMIDRIATDTLKGMEVITLSGARKYHGKKINQKNCQQIVSEIVEETEKSGKSVLIISNIMAQRSFSIPEITELYLAYDAGQVGATLQKMSRVLTPGDISKVGKIFSLSFDANRDDKFDSMLIETAINYKKRHGIKSLADALREVLHTIDMFKCTPNGAIALDKDAYLEGAMARNGVSRVLGKIVNLSKCPPEIITALANGNSDYICNARQEATKTGKTRDVNKQKNGIVNRTGEEQKEIGKAREVIVTIFENLDLIINYADTTNLHEAMEIIDKDPLAQDGIEMDFGVNHGVIGYLLENDIIKQEHAELMYDH